MNFLTKYWLRLKWKQQNYQPPIEKSDEEHVCAFCNEHYTGNYCPQCGLQYGRERFTWRSILLNLMDLWGVGKRNVFRTIWHLLWRPGHLMYDFLRYKHRAYFPPVPLLVATCLLFTLLVNVFNIKWSQDLDSVYEIHNSVEKTKADVNKTMGVQDVPMTAEEQLEEKQLEEALNKQMMSLEELLKAERQWSRNHMEYSLVISTLLFILLASWIFYQSPRIQLSIVESFYVQIYIACQMMLIAIPYTLINGEITESSWLPYPLPSILAFAILVVDYYQLCGYSLWGTIWRLIAMVCVYILVGTIIGLILTVTFVLAPVVTGFSIGICTFPPIN